MSRKLEQEVKFYIQDLAGLEERIRKLGGTEKQGRVLERNLRFDTPRRDLSAGFRVLRLRQDEKTRLTYKGQSDPTREVSARTELEVEVSDLKTTKSILEALGYEVMVIYEKYRKAYMIGDVEISLDEMPFGNFTEVEGPDTDSIRKTAEKLGLNWNARSKLSYLTLFYNLKNKMGLEMDNLSFKAFEDVQVTAEDLNLAPADS